MASNYVSSGSADATIEFDRPVDYLNIRVAVGVTFEMSFDNWTTSFFVPVGMNNLNIGPIDGLQVKADGDWNIIAVQA